jgi:hypothetical protein
VPWDRFVADSPLEQSGFEPSVPPCDPDWTVGIKLGRDKSGGFWLLDMVRGRANPGDCESATNWDPAPEHHKALILRTELIGGWVLIDADRDPGWGPLFSIKSA